jgi:hypothetical protein
VDIDPDELLRLRTSLRSVTDYLDELMQAEKFPGKGRSQDAQDAILGWWEDRVSAVQTARRVLSETEH